jgi:hypothetical protein
MAQATHEQVNLMLHLFEMRREPRLRQAREWFGSNFQAANAAEMMQKYPPNSDGNVNFRMVVGYWDMVAAIANRGLMDEELFFETSGEQWMVWERIKPLAAEFRQMFKNPNAWHNLEEHCRRMEAWREKKAPGSTEAMREMMKKFAEAAKSQKAGA